jgi:hypothetical protein
MNSILPTWVALLENQELKGQKRGNIAAKVAKTRRN